MSTLQLKLLFFSLCIVNTFSYTLFSAADVIDLEVTYSKAPYTLWEFTHWGDKDMKCSYNIKEKEVVCIDSKNKGMCFFDEAIVLTSNDDDFYLKSFTRKGKEYYLVGTYSHNATIKVFVSADKKDYTCLSAPK